MTTATRTTTEMLASLSDAALAEKSLDWLLWILDLLPYQHMAKAAQAQVAANELRATERLRLLAEKHEDDTLAQGLAADEAHMRQVVPL